MPICDEIPVFRYRLIQDVGLAYVMGAGGSSVFYLLRGLRNSPSGGRLAGAVRAVGTNVPLFAAGCVAYSAMFCAAEAVVSHARQRNQDHWDAIAAGAAASGLFRIDRGAAAAARNTLFGATLFAGTTVLALSACRFISRLLAPKYRPLPAPAVALITEGEKGAL